MNINQTPADRSIRAIVGLAIVASPVMGFDTVPYNFLGLVPWLTGVLGFCPIYHALGLSTVTKASYKYLVDGLKLNKVGHQAHA